MIFNYKFLFFFTIESVYDTSSGEKIRHLKKICSENTYCVFCIFIYIWIMVEDMDINSTLTLKKLSL